MPAAPTIEGPVRVLMLFDELIDHSPLLQHPFLPFLIASRDLTSGDRSQLRVDRLADQPAVEEPVERSRSFEAGVREKYGVCVGGRFKQGEVTARPWE